MVNYKVFFGLFIALMLLPSLAFATADPNWWNPAWQYRLDITINHTKIDSNLTDFPLLVSVTEPHLANALANGNDILLCKDNNDDQLKHEIEYFNQTAGTLVLWVKTNLSANIDTVIYLYYGNSASGNQQDRNNTWGVDYKMIQHLQETSGNRIDSTNNTNDGVTTCSATEGKIDGASEFSGATNINCGHQESLNITNAITISAWVKCGYIPIYDVDDLQAMENDLDVAYILMNDIDCSATATWNEDPLNPGTYFGFAPIGDDLVEFTGILNGNGHKLTNLYINRPLENYVGLFGWISGAEVTNLIIEDATIVGYDDVGGLTGCLQSTIINHIKIININLTGDTNVGGIAGRVKTGIYNSYVTGAVNGVTNVGGMVGTRIGGYKYSFKLYDCWASCSVTGTNAVGGLAGYAQGHTRSKTRFTRSYSTGLVTGVTDVGGMAGMCQYAENRNSFWDTQTSGQATSCLGTGKTTAEMKQQATFTADPTYPFNFTHTWNINEGVTYPWLRDKPISLTQYLLVSKGRDIYSLEMNQFGTELKGFINNTEITFPLIANIDTLVALTYDGANLKLFVNGVQVNSIPLIGAIPKNTTDLTIGDNFVGIIDEVRISNIAKTSEWVNVSYKNQNLSAGFLTSHQVDALYFDLKIIDHLATAINTSRVVIRDNIQNIVTEEDTSVLGQIITQAYIQSKTAHAIKVYKYGKEMMASVLDITKNLDWTFTLYTDPYITETDVAVVGTYTGIIINHVTETINISESHTIDEIYDYCQYNIISNPQPDINQIIRTGNGISFTSEYDFLINDGITVSASGKKVTMVIGKTYNLYNSGQFTGIIADSTKTRVPVVLNGVVNGSRYRIEKTSDGTMLFEGTQSGSGEITNYYEHTTNLGITIKVRKSSGGTRYYPITLTGTIVDTSFGLDVLQIEDKQANNDTTNSNIILTATSKIISIISPETEVTIQELTNAIRDWEDELINMEYSGVIDTEGKANLGGGVETGIVMTLNNLWQIQFWGSSGYTVIKGGTLVGGVGDQPIKATGTAGDLTIQIQPTDAVITTTNSDNILSEIEDIKGTGFVKDTDSLTNIQNDTSSILSTLSTLIFDVWNYTTRILTIADWTTDNDLSILQTHGDNNWDTATGFSTHSPFNVWNYGTRELTNPDDYKTNLTNIESNVDRILDATEIKRGTVTDASATSSLFTTDLTETSNQFWLRNAIVFTSGQCKGQIRKIHHYDGTTKAFKMYTPLAYAPAQGDTFVIIATRNFRVNIDDLNAITDYVWDENHSEHTNPDSFGELLSNLNSTSGNGTYNYTGLTSGQNATLYDTFNLAEQIYNFNRTNNMNPSFVLWILIFLGGLVSLVYGQRLKKIAFIIISTMLFLTLSLYSFSFIEIIGESGTWIMIGVSMMGFIIALIYTLQAGIIMLKESSGEKKNVERL